MAKTSKYTDQQINPILAEMIAVLEKHQASVDLSLVLLGNMTSNLLINNMGEKQRVALAQAFAKALLDSVQPKK
ncbi:hypothetical protein EV694_0086 [Volucribacter psittacicida]|uniref:UPF0352 protein EV694_0086 n=1 Tax=Volucribacter psittacicida TaxID=203482 RepID=A0A4R1G4Z7_9PAST|nr:DUF1414 domain-containing protein [Volucribacter psittacicida]TCK01475.1 hypothetical protein EV694_0086 [Volucribacter psittacicida]